MARYEEAVKNDMVFLAMLLPFIYYEAGRAILVLVYPKLLLSKTMCMTFGITAGSILTFLTIKTRSIWPAAVMHAVNNSSPGVLGLILNTHELGKMNTIAVVTITLIPLFIIGIACLLIMVKQNQCFGSDNREDMQ